MSSAGITKSKIKLNDFTLSFNESGDGIRTVIFLHGFPFDKSSWDKQLIFLSKNGFKGIAVDIRGFGKSTPGNEPFSIAQFADDLIHFMDLKGIQKAAICGLSMGGYILLNVTARYRERLDGIILCDTQCQADTTDAKLKRMETIKNLTEKSKEAFADGFIKKVFFEKTMDQKKSMVAKTKSVILNTSLDSIKSGLSALADRNDTCDLLSEITLPTLFICGKEDTLTPPAKSISMHKSIKYSTICMIDNAGHLSNLEKPIKFNNVIHDFLLKIYPT
jgi:3-oxoadipate enol-lactonase